MYQVITEITSSPVVTYIASNQVESVAAVISISSKLALKDKWLWTPSVMFAGSFLWCVWSFSHGFWVAGLLNALLSVLSLINQYKWMKGGK